MPESTRELPRFEVPGKTTAFDLLDDLPARRVNKTPLWDVIDGIVFPLLRKYGFQRSVREQVNALVPLMANRVGLGRVGYLIRINVYADEHGNTFVPGGEIVSALGLGIEPLDALAESYRAGGLNNIRPNNLRDESSYCWMIREGSRFTCTAIPAELARGLEQKAFNEAERRDILGGFLRDTKTPTKQISAATYWSEIVQARAIELETLGLRERMDDLQNRMTEEQSRFNRAYEGFQRTVQEMADEAKETKFLDAVDTVLSVISTGIKVADTASAPSRNTKPPMSQENVKTWRMSRERMLNGNYERLTIEVNTAADNLDRIQSTMRSEFESRRIPVPASSPIPRIIRE